MKRREERVQKRKRWEKDYEKRDKGR